MGLDANSVKLTQRLPTSIYWKATLYFNAQQIMHSFRHINPRYVVDRSLEALYQYRHPDMPWLTGSANEILSSLLRKTDRGLEYGSGRSTLWFAQRAEHLISIEHDEKWFKKIQLKLREKKIENVEYRWMSDSVVDANPPQYVAYSKSIDANSLDFALVDGIFRDECALVAIDKIRVGGLLIIDNVNWFLPSTSISPGSRSLAKGPDGKRWAEVQTILSSWRSIWTSSGVTDTAIYFKQ